MRDNSGIPKNNSERSYIAIARSTASGCVRPFDVCDSNGCYYDQQAFIVLGWLLGYESVPALIIYLR